MAHPQKIGNLNPSILPKWARHYREVVQLCAVDNGFLRQVMNADSYDFRVYLIRQAVQRIERARV